MLNWRLSYGQGDDVSGPKYDSGLSGELPRSHIPLITHSQVVNLISYIPSLVLIYGHSKLINRIVYFLQISGELPAASPDHHMMSPGGGGKRVHPIPYTDGNQSCTFLSCVHLGIPHLASLQF